MSDAVNARIVSPLGQAAFDGFAKVREVCLLGMISLRAKADVPGLAEAIMAVVGTPVPAVRQIETAGERAAGWMSPDEYLLIMPYGETDAALAKIATALKGQHHLAVTLSDARAVFRIEGARADQVLAKLSPVDFATMGATELRRTRAAQVAAAFWRDGDGFMLVCFRSVAGYVMGLLGHSAAPGSQLD